MAESFHFSHIADYYNELWRANEFSSVHIFIAQDYDALCSIDESLKEIEGLASTLHHQAAGDVHHTLVA